MCSLTPRNRRRNKEDLTDIAGKSFWWEANHKRLLTTATQCPSQGAFRLCQTILCKELELLLMLAISQIISSAPSGILLILKSVMSKGTGHVKFSRHRSSHKLPSQIKMQPFNSIFMSAKVSITVGILQPPAPQEEMEITGVI